MENYRKCWVSYDCLWKLYIKSNIPSFEHSAALTVKSAPSHLGCFTQ